MNKRGRNYNREPQGRRQDLPERSRWRDEPLGQAGWRRSRQP